MPWVGQNREVSHGSDRDALDLQLTQPLCTFTWISYCCEETETSHKMGGFS